VWPSPPYFELPINKTTSAPERCEIDLLNSTQVSGRMVHLQPDEELVEIQPPHAREIQSIGFSEFRRLTLSRPVIIRKHQGLRDAQVGVLPPDANCQSFVINYHNGETFVGETIGFVPENHGLLPTASVGSSQAPPAAVDNSAPSAIRTESTYKSGKVVQVNAATFDFPPLQYPLGNGEYLEVP
jgi:hypothetical protein